MMTIPRSTVFSNGFCLSHVWQALADEIDCASDIDIHHEVEVVKTERIPVSIKNL